MSENVLSKLAGGLNDILLPIATLADDPERIQRIKDDLALPPGDGAWLDAIGALAALQQELGAMSARDEASIRDAEAALAIARSLYQALSGLTVQNAAGTAEALGREMIDALISVWLRRNHPVAFSLAILLGLIEPIEEQPIEMVIDGDDIRYRGGADVFRPSRITELVRDPVAYFKGEYLNDLATDEDAARVASKLFSRVARLLRAADIACRFGIKPREKEWLGDAAPLMRDALAIYVDDLLAGAEAESGIILSISPASRGDLGLVCSPFGALNFTRELSTWTVSCVLEAEVEAAAWGRHGFTLLSSASGTVAARLTAVKQPLDDGPAYLWGAADGSRLAVGTVTLGVEAVLSETDPRIEVLADFASVALVLSPADLDGFLASLLPADGIQANFDFGLSWSSNRGLTFKGAMSLDLRIPVGISLGPVLLSDCHLKLAARDGEVDAEASLTLRATLGPVRAVIDRIGLAAQLTFPEEGGSLGVADLDFRFKWPSGIGLVVEAAGVATGGGFLFRDEAQGLYAGVLELSLSELFTLKAIGLITTKMPDGSPGFTMVIFITAEDFQPIQLGMGFTLNGIGGMLAINRTFDENALREGLQTGVLASILFPRDPVANAPAIINALSVAFPARRGAYLFGVLVKIGWFTPTLVAFELALILELGARRRLLVLGRVSALLPSADNDLVRLNLESMGVIDFDEGTVALDAVLVDSRLVHKFVLTGGMALRARWSDGPGSSFVLAVGGLNPRFAPPPGLPKLVRIAIALSSGDNPRITCAAYFAITANTLQFGAHAELYAAAYGFSIEGDIGFDVLIQYQPLHFIADFHASVQLKRGSRSLFKVTVDGSLEGPRPLRVSGKASFEICWCDFSVRFDKTLVDGEPPPLPPAVDVLAALREALADQQSWQARSESSHGVVLRSLSKGDSLIVDPVGRLVVRQQVVPLNTDRDVELFGGAPVSGTRRFSLAATLNGAQLQASAVREQFAPSQYFDFTDDEKLIAPSFQEMDAGIAVGDTAIAFAAAEIVPALLEYDSIVIDAPGQAPPDAAVTLDAGALHLLAETGAAARAPVRRVGKARFRDAAVAPAVTLHAPEWRIVSVDDRAPIATVVEAKSWSEQSATLATLNRDGVRWQLVPAHELVA